MIINDSVRDLNDFRRKIKYSNNLNSKRDTKAVTSYNQTLVRPATAAGRSKEATATDKMSNSNFGSSSFLFNTSAMVADYPMNRHADQVVKNFYRI